MQISKDSILKSGVILKDEKWFGNIIIKNNLIIPENVTVIILPGTKIKFISQKIEDNSFIEEKLRFLSNNYSIEYNKHIGKSSIIVYGNLSILGEKNNRVSIGNCGWNGFIFVSSCGKINFKYTDIRYGFGIVLDNNSKLSKINNCLIEQCCIGIASFSKIIIKNNDIRYNNIGVILFDKGLVLSSNINDNLLYGIILQTNKSYVLNNVISLNSTAVFVFNSFDIKVIDNDINNNICGVIIRKSENIVINNNNNNNYSSLEVEDDSNNITISGFLIKSSIGISVKHFSNIQVKNLSLILVGNGICTWNNPYVKVIDSNFIENVFNFIAMNNSNIDILNSHCRGNNVNLLLKDEPYINILNSRLNSNNNNIASLGNYAQVNIYKSDIQSNNNVCNLDLYSQMFVYETELVGNKFVELLDNSNVFLQNSNLQMIGNVFLSRGNNFISVSNCNIESKNGKVFHLYDSSILKIEKSKIYSNFRFCEAMDNSNIEIVDSDIGSNDNFLELNNNSSSNIYNTKISNNIGCFLKTNDESVSFIDKCNISLQDSFIKQNLFGKFICLNSNINGNASFELENKSFFYFKNNVVEANNLYIGAFLSQENYIVKNKFVLDKLNTKLNTCEFILRDNNILSNTIINTELYFSSLFLHQNYIDTKLIKTNGIKSNINIDILKINADIESNFSFSNLFIDHFYLDSQINNEKYSIINQSIFNLNNSLCNGSRIYSIDSDINISDSLINNFKISVNNNDKCKIKGSKVKGEIRAEGISEIEIGGSEIGEIDVSNKSKVEIKDSDIEGRKVRVREGGEVQIYDSEIKIKEDVNIEDAGIVKIYGCKINASNGLVKRGYDNLIIDNTKLESENCCLSLSGGFDVNCTGIILQSKKDFSVKATGNINITFEDIKIISKSGFLCSNVNCNIINIDASIFVKFLDINYSKFVINNSKIIYEIPKDFISLYNTSNLVLNNTDINFSNNTIFLQYLNSSLINLKENSILKIYNLNSHIKYSNQLLFLKSDTNSYFDISNAYIKNYNNLIKMTMLSFGIIKDSVIDIKLLVANLFQNTGLISLNNTFTNLYGYKFDFKDMSRFYMYHSKVLKNNLLFMMAYSQAFLCENLFELSGKICEIKENSLFEDYKSEWIIDGDYNNKYAFYLRNISKFILNLSKIETKEQLFCALDNTKVNMKNTSINSYNKGLFALVKNKSCVTIENSNIYAFSFAKIKNYANLFINNSFIYAKSSILKLLGNSKVIINKSSFKNKDFRKRGIAFEKYNNSILKIKDSSIKHFNIGIKYDNTDNIHIDGLNIECSNKFYFTNDKRYISVKNPSKRKFLYKIQQFVLSTNNVFFINIIYKFIYLISIYIYASYMNKRNVTALFLRRGMLNNWIAGSSDIDYLTILKDSNIIYECHCIYDIKKNYKKIRKFFPFYGENLIINKKELNFYLKYGGMRSENLQNSKLLYGKQEITKVEREVNNLLNKVHICSEILNSYILLSNNYFYNVDILSDLCFVKAATDILKNIEYFYTGEKPLSRINFLLKKNCENEIFKILYYVLKNIKRINKEQRNLIFKYILESLNELSKKFNNYVVLNNQVEKCQICEYEKISTYKEIELLEEYIEMIILDSPGSCHLILNDVSDINKILLIYEKIKEKQEVYNTPIMFFTKEMFQMLILSNFKNSPLEYYKINNINELYKHRKVYLKEKYEYFFYKNDFVRNLVLTAISELSIHINDIDITDNFKNIKHNLFSLLLQVLQFYLYLENGITLNSYSDIVKAYDNKEELKEIISVFDKGGLNLSDDEKVFKVIVFIKKIQRELMKYYE